MEKSATAVAAGSRLEEWEKIICRRHDPRTFKVTESTVTSKGVIIVNFERAGTVPTGSV